MTVVPGRSCLGCIHFRATPGWLCSLNTVEELRQRGHSIDEAALPSPEEFSCEDWEPP